MQPEIYVHFHNQNATMSDVFTLVLTTLDVLRKEGQLSSSDLLNGMRKEVEVKSLGAPFKLKLRIEGSVNSDEKKTCSVKDGTSFYIGFEIDTKGDAAPFNDGVGTIHGEILRNRTFMESLIIKLHYESFDL